MANPAASDLKTRFPEFADVDDARIDAVIDETGSFVDDSWIESDIVPAKLHLAAHILALEGALREDGEGGGAQGAIQQVRVGDSTIQFGQVGAGAIAAGQTLGLTNTYYGMRFMALRNRNVSRVAVAK